jgi:hypothetical protein
MSFTGNRYSDISKPLRGFSGNRYSGNRFSEDRCLIGLVNKYISFPSTVDTLLSGFYTEKALIDCSIVSEFKYRTVRVIDIIIDYMDKDRVLSGWLESKHGLNIKIPDWNLRKKEAIKRGSKILINYCEAILGSVEKILTTGAHTVYIAGPPIIGTNQTITNAYSLYC